MGDATIHVDPPAGDDHDESEMEEGELYEPVFVAPTSIPFTSYPGLSPTSHPHSPPTPKFSPSPTDPLYFPCTQNHLNTDLSKTYVGTCPIEEYDNRERIGKGTFGEVTIATHKETQRKVALKRIIVHKEKDGLPITAVREINILKGLRHKSVIELLGMAVAKGNPDEYEPATIYMIFPYMNHDLVGLLENRHVSLEPNQIKSFTKQLLEGVAYLHRNHFLHRDLKSSNILIDNEGNLKIADFGLARSYNTADKTIELTPNVITLWYRPPELLLGHKTYTSAVDMWGVGCIFAEMWDRKAIFKGETEVELLDKILTVCGTPDAKAWPEFSKLAASASIRPKQESRKVLDIYKPDRLDFQTIDLLNTFLVLNPARRPTAEAALKHEYFHVEPEPAKPSTPDFPGWPESHELGIRAQIDQELRQHNTAQTQPSRPSAHHDALIVDGQPVRRPRLHDDAETRQYNRHRDDKRPGRRHDHRRFARGRGRPGNERGRGGRGKSAHDASGEPTGEGSVIMRMKHPLPPKPILRVPFSE
ncbi:hypothetical protein SpCBS45565_g02324 [Spizellomyces sp. 'palustris']|nr:hypothetical protein SpCBS45565_g02324 [Spizellomyces sp. 'palustris']